VNSQSKSTLHSSSSESGSTKQPDMDDLRKLLLGSDYQSLLDFKQCLNDPKYYQENIANVVTEAIEIRNTQDDSIANALSATVERSLSASVKANPEPIAEALYPVMGPAIRRSITETMNQALENFNRALEQSFSLKALKWRIDALRSGRTYAEIAMLKTLDYQVEQVFLIHRESSVLLQHVVNEDAVVADADMVSGMLSAIQDFVADSFSVDSDDALNSLRLGDLSVSIETGPKAILAAVVRGGVPDILPVKLQETLESVHQDHHHALSEFNGDPQPFEASQQVMQACLMSQRQEKTEKKIPWPFIAVSAGLILALGGWQWFNYQRNATWTNALQQLKSEPGFFISSSGKENKQYYIEGLRDPKARTPELVLQNSPVSSWDISWQLRPNLKSSTLQLFGVTTEDKFTALKKTVLAIEGIDNIETNHLTIMPSAPKLLAAQSGSPDAELVHQVNALTPVEFAFRSNQIRPAQDSQEYINSLKRKLQKLGENAVAQEKRLYVQFRGYADTPGPILTNIQLSKERAEYMRNLLMQGIDMDIESHSIGLGSEKYPDNVSSINANKVTMHILLKKHSTTQ